MGLQRIVCLMNSGKNFYSRLPVRQLEDYLASNQEDGGSNPSRETNYGDCVKTPKDYYSTHMVLYEEPSEYSYLCLDVLPFLKGMLWDDLALAYVHSLRPSSIRVTDGCIKCDSRVWRVTVFVDENNIITNIEQEVKVGLLNGIHPSGHALELEFRKRKTDP